MQAVLKLIHSQYLQAEPGAAGAPAAPPAASPARMVSRIAGRTPLVLDSPHSGTVYPADFRAALDLPVLRRAEDTHVEKLYAFAPGLGVGWVEAHFPRIYLDANRDTTELDATLLDAPWPDPVTADPVVLQKVRLGKGLIWKFTDEGEPIYDRPLGVDEVRARIDRCWRPYHAAVAAEIDAAHARHGYSIHLNCHSMPAVAASHATLYPGLHHADFVVGDRDGATASPALSQQICAFLRERGYSVDYNHPYKGVELVRRYGNPAQHRHSIQVEINRKLYMDEQTLDILPAGFDRLRADLRALVESLLATDPRG
ncbi:N-formylglutamate amidohydrolase [Diaphorobacter sp. JS3050]|uniref:N-formylglutamate amidohydrolase n=1 Tax=unclassified Diaphorobacter TaxID=2649760 RepID=UPI000CDA518D|nr:MULTISPECIES: N-formylglutamate amidohydrolase [unclassified Diaphorobacter]POR09896.1 N-formylglutamate amidohydrolase [Diaphorobacter sp. LR2014-1]QJY34708.1 N-formylglutamate amidohydrolase [Diaphorobacter sp. JS3050]